MLIIMYRINELNKFKQIMYFSSSNKKSQAYFNPWTHNLMIDGYYMTD